MNMREEKNGAVLKVCETREVSTIIHVFLFWQTFCPCLPSAGREERRFIMNGCLHLDTITTSAFKSHQLTLMHHKPHFQIRRLHLITLSVRTYTEPQFKHSISLVFPLQLKEKDTICISIWPGKELWAPLHREQEGSPIFMKSIKYPGHRWEESSKGSLFYKSRR